MNEAIECLNKMKALHKKIEMQIFNGYAIPDKLQLGHNKLMNDYNEAVYKAKK